MVERTSGVVPAEPAPFSLVGRRIAAVLNRSSGRVDATCEALSREILASAGAASTEVTCAAPEDLDQVLDRAAAEADVLVVLAGDGTIRTAAERCGPDGPVLLLLPGGTMNVLTRALYGRRPWPELLRATLAAPHAEPLSGGRAGGRLFLVSAILGVPSRWVQAREALRQAQLFRAAAWAAQALAHPWPSPLDYDLGGGVTGTARAVAVRCPLTSRALDPHDQALEAAAIDPRSAAQALSLGLDALVGRWRRNQAVADVRTARIRVSRGRHDVPAVLDGESLRLTGRLEVTFEPKAATVLLPPRSSER